MPRYLTAADRTPSRLDYGLMLRYVSYFDFRVMLFQIKREVGSSLDAADCSGLHWRQCVAVFVVSPTRLRYVLASPAGSQPVLHVLRRVGVHPRRDIHQSQPPPDCARRLYETSCCRSALMSVVVNSMRS